MRTRSTTQRRQARRLSGAVTVAVLAASAAIPAAAATEDPEPRTFVIGT